MADTAMHESRVRRFFADVWGGQNPAYAHEFFAPDAQLSDGVGPEAKLSAVARYRAAFPDLRLDLAHLVAAGDAVAVHWTATGTDTGGFLSRRPTGTPISVWGAEFFRFAGERVIEDWVGVDYLGLMIQLGVVPSPWPTC
jgi:predicted ester cyclase